MAQAFVSRTPFDNTGAGSATLAVTISLPSGDGILLHIYNPGATTPFSTPPTLTGVTFTFLAGQSMSGGRQELWQSTLAASTITSQTLTITFPASASNTTAEACIYSGTNASIVDITGKNTGTGGSPQTATATVVTASANELVALFVACVDNGIPTTVAGTGYTLNGTTFEGGVGGGVDSETATSNALTATQGTSVSPTMVLSSSFTPVWGAIAVAIAVPVVIGTANVETISNIQANSALALTPALPTNALTMDQQIAPDSSGSPGTWANVTTGVGAFEKILLPNLTTGTKYWARVNANGVSSTQGGTPVSFTTPNVISGTNRLSVFRPW